MTIKDLAETVRTSPETAIKTLEDYANNLVGKFMLIPGNDTIKIDEFMSGYIKLGRLYEKDGRLGNTYIYDVTEWCRQEHLTPCGRAYNSIELSDLSTDEAGGFSSTIRELIGNRAREDRQYLAYRLLNWFCGEVELHAVREITPKPIKTAYITTSRPKGSLPRPDLLTNEGKTILTSQEISYEEGMRLISLFRQLPTKEKII